MADEKKTSRVELDESYLDQIAGGVSVNMMDFLGRAMSKAMTSGKKGVEKKPGAAFAARKNTSAE